MSYVLSLAIGPVQDFIATARRCRDLWFGSWLLSDLARTAANSLEAQAAPAEAIVFPAGALTAGNKAPVANKILAIVEGGPAEVRAAAKAATSGARARLETSAASTFALVGVEDPNRARHLHEADARAQIAEFLEVAWAAVPITAAGYADARVSAERLLAARKNTKLWTQPGAWARERVPKCALCGVRESVLDEALFNSTRAMSAERRRRWYGVHGAERLCGVCLFKRHGTADGKQQRFFSTPHLAALPWMAGVTTSAGVDVEWERFSRALDADEATRELLVELDVVPGKPHPVFGRCDGALFFEGRLVEELEDREVEREVVERATSALRHFRTAIGRGAPSPYYAILLADGDRMGKVIEAQLTPAAHRQLSAALDRFATAAEEIVRTHGGSLIYSGGDDVLALLPLHTALDCAANLARRFRDSLADWRDADGNGATLSVGLAAVHELMPLDEALEAARSAERRAKVEGGRNALALVVCPRGGAAVYVEGKWDKFDVRLRQFAVLLEDDSLSGKAGFELADLERLTASRAGDPLRGVDAAMATTLDQARRSEALRILGRKRADAGDRAVDEDTLTQLRAHLETMDADALGRELVAARVFAQAARQAKPASSEDAR